MKLPIIQSLWIGADLTNLEKLCIQSFIDNGHEFHLHTYADIGGIPAGAVVKDANEILPADKIFKYNTGSYAGFSNWFRYALIAKHGGFWVDMDEICIRSFDFDDDLVLCRCADGLFNTTPIYAKPNHPLMIEMAKVCANFQNREGAKFGAVGGLRPLTRAIVKMQLQEHGLPFYYFGIGRWNTYCDKTFAAGSAAFPKDTHSIHFGNESAAKRNFDKNARYDSESLFEQLKTKHNITTAQTAARITHAQINAEMVDHNLYKFDRRIARKKKIKQLAAGILAAIIALVVFVVVI